MEDSFRVDTQAQSGESSRSSETDTLITSQNNRYSLPEQDAEYSLPRAIESGFASKDNEFSASLVANTPVTPQDRQIPSAATFHTETDLQSSLLPLQAALDTVVQPQDNQQLPPAVVNIAATSKYNQHPHSISINTVGTSQDDPRRPSTVFEQRHSPEGYVFPISPTTSPPIQIHIHTTAPTPPNAQHPPSAVRRRHLPVNYDATTSPSRTNSAVQTQCEVSTATQNQGLHLPTVNGQSHSSIYQDQSISNLPTIPVIQPHNKDIAPSPYKQQLLHPAGIGGKSSSVYHDISISQLPTTPVVHARSDTAIYAPHNELLTPGIVQNRRPSVYHDASDLQLPTIPAIQTRSEVKTSLAQNESHFVPIVVDEKSSSVYHDPSISPSAIPAVQIENNATKLDEQSSLSQAASIGQHSLHFHDALNYHQGAVARSRVLIMLPPESEECVSSSALDVNRGQDSTMPQSTGKSKQAAPQAKREADSQEDLYNGFCCTILHLFWIALRTVTYYACVVPAQAFVQFMRSDLVKEHLTDLVKFLTSWSKVLSALFARILFMIHSTASVFIVVASLKLQFVYLLFTPLCLVVLEAFLTVKLRQNQEWKWVTPSILIYQLCTVPAIWLMEYQDFGRRIAIKENITEPVDCAGKTLSFGDVYFSGNITDLADKVDDFCGCGQCAPITEQVLLLLMIAGRWLIPKSGEITSDQKAQLMLVNIAIASDILELLDMMKDEAVKHNYVIVTTILTIWTISLVQFAIVSTATNDDPPEGWSCFETEIWSLVTLLLLDDIPFLIIRLVIMLNFELLSYSGLFFICKNGLVLMLDIYRIGTLYKETKRLKKQSEERREKKISKNEDVEAGVSSAEAKLSAPDPTPPESPTLLRIRR